MHCEAHISTPKSDSSLDNKKITKKQPCPKCHSDKTRKKGFRTTQHRGKQQRYVCDKCGYSFTLDNGFWKMKNSEKIVCQALDTYFEGLSLRKMRRNLGKYQDTKISHQSIHNWLIKYSTIAGKYIEKLKPKLSGHYLTDETMIKCNKEYHNLGVVFDKETRYVIASRYSPHENLKKEDNIKLWSKARDIQRPKKFTSDCHRTYEISFNKVFYNRYSDFQVEWEKINTQKTGRYNYIMEKLWNTLKERVKIMRGFKAVWSARTILNGFFVWYNFIRPHMTLNTTPSNKAGIAGFDGWVELINSALSN